MTQKCIICGNEFEGSGCPFCGYSADNAEEPQYLEAGVRLSGGRYVIGCAIGAGGFGITYSAWDTLLKQRVAIKEYLPGEFSTRVKGAFDVTVYGGEKSEQFEDGLRKFVDESRRLAKFGRVPGIVQIFECFQENNTAYIVMEYLEGETLGARLKREKKISVDEAIRIITPILDALDAVHKEGIIHRDIAPNNVFLCSDGNVKLLDFGAARSATGTHSKSLTVLYKNGYTPEEQYSSRGNQGPWTDVYSTAATMYTAVTGVVPEGAMERLLKDNLKEPGKMGVKISNNVENALMNALNVDYRTRTKSAAAFNEQLHSDKRVKRTFRRTRTRIVGRVPVSVWILGGALLAVVAVMLILLRTEVIDFYSTPFANLFVEADKARVMNLINMDKDEAKARLQSVGLNMEISETIYSNDVAENLIISQSIEKGKIVDRGTGIQVTVSKGAEIVTIPELVNHKWDEKKTELEELHLKYEVIEEESIYAPGYIVSSEPSQGASIEQGKTVTVRVSAGMSGITDDTVVIDDLTEMNVDDARKLLAEKKIYLVIGTHDFDDNVPKNLIMGQSIQAGISVACGEIVYVTISDGIEQKEVPQLEGLSEDAAVKSLEELSLTAIITTVVDRDREEGTVLSQSVKPGTMVDKYTEIEIGVVSHGYEIPDLSGLSQTEAQNICAQKGFPCEIQEVFGGSGQVKSQTPEAGEIVETQETITVQIGISEGEFSQKLLDEINRRRAASGLGALNMSAAWNSAAQTLANTGYDSVKFQNEGYDFTWVYKEKGLSATFTFWATRNNMTTVSDAVSRLPMTGNALMRAGMDSIGIAYYGSKIVMIIADT